MRMAPMREAPRRVGSVPEVADASAEPLRWRQVFPGDERQLGELRHWLAHLLPANSSRDDVVSVAVEYATNAIKFSSSGRSGWFTVEITWSGQMVRVAVADSGGPTVPHMVDDPRPRGGTGGRTCARARSPRAAPDPSRHAAHPNAGCSGMLICLAGSAPARVSRSGSVGAGLLIVGVPTVGGAAVLCPACDRGAPAVTVAEAITNVPGCAGRACSAPVRADTYLPPEPPPQP